MDISCLCILTQYCRMRPNLIYTHFILIIAMFKYVVEYFKLTYHNDGKFYLANKNIYY